MSDQWLYLILSKGCSFFSKLANTLPGPKQINSLTFWFLQYSILLCHSTVEVTCLTSKGAISSTLSYWQHCISSRRHNQMTKILTGLAVTLEMTSMHGFLKVILEKASCIAFAASCTNEQWKGALIIYQLFMCQLSIQWNWTYETGKSTALAANLLLCRILDASSTPLLVPLITTCAD